MLFAEDEHTQLSASNRVEIGWNETTTWNDAIGAVFLWITPLPGGISIPLLNIELKKDVYFKHEESVELNIYGSDADFDLLLGHSSEMILSDIGSLLGVLHIGVSFGDETWLFGLEGGLRAKVTF